MHIVNSYAQICAILLIIPQGVTGNRTFVKSGSGGIADSKGNCILICHQAGVDFDSSLTGNSLFSTLTANVEPRPELSRR